MKQRRLPGVNLRIKKEYGGTHLVGNRKIKRPFLANKFLHTVFRSDLAKGEISMFKKCAEIEAILFISSENHKIVVEQYTNSGNHLHILLRANSRENLQRFFKEFARKVAQLMVGRTRKFWTQIVYSRIVEWGRDQNQVVIYLIRNFLEVSKVIPYQRTGPPDFLVF